MLGGHFFVSDIICASLRDAWQRTQLGHAQSFLFSFNPSLAEVFVSIFLINGSLLVLLTTHLSQTILVILEAFYSVEPFLKCFRYGVVVEW